MRNQQELNVDVTHRAANAADRTRTNRRLQGVMDTVQGQPERAEAWWKHWFEWETLTVAGKTIEKGWVVPQPLGIALIVLILGGVGSLYWRLTDKVSEMSSSQAVKSQELREMLIRLDQRLIDKQAMDDKEQRERKNKDELQDLQIKDVNDKLLVLNARKGK